MPPISIRMPCPATFSQAATSWLGVGWAEARGQPHGHGAAAGDHFDDDGLVGGSSPCGLLITHTTLGCLEITQGEPSAPGRACRSGGSRDRRGRRVCVQPANALRPLAAPQLKLAVCASIGRAPPAAGEPLHIHTRRAPAAARSWLVGCATELRRCQRASAGCGAGKRRGLAPGVASERGCGDGGEGLHTRQDRERHTRVVSRAEGRGGRAARRSAQDTCRRALNTVEDRCV
ncbi:MAG: hypothetical protein J3K34DRAFT_435136 [Monoraphidium minutum]|nr:MAG: hypothetical protein J3K34DRAFT_435136 [Monoraphidium minutum]